MSTEFEKRPFIEMIILLGLMFIGSFLIPQLKGIFSILPIVYFLVESGVRKRKDSGFKKSILADLKKSWIYVLLVAIVLQSFYFFIYKNVFPEVLEHVLERASLIKNVDGKLFVALLVLALGEEIVFRGLIQKRLGWVMKPAYAILLTSLLFALMHISSGEPLVVFLDLTTVFIDSVVFGIIFYKTNNIYASWIAHAGANIIATLFITTL